MIRDLVSDQPDAATVADVCIVGAGAAGIALAVELVGRGKSVTLLEGGGGEIEESSQEPYRSDISGLPHAGIHSGRFRARGGTTTKWGGQILELDEGDFAPRPWVPGSGWPLAKHDLARFYQRALEVEGLGAVLQEDDAVWQNISGHAPEFPRLDSYCSRWCPEPNFARLHEETLANAPGLTVWLHANATEILLEDEHAVGVRCRTLTGTEAVFRAREYIFCMGAIESSRFFLQPRASALPWNGSGLLGRHFQDHIDSNGAKIIPRDPGRFHNLFDNVFVRGLKYHPKLRLARAVQQGSETLNVAATMLFVGNADEDLVRMKATAKDLTRGRFANLRPADVTFMAANLPMLMRQTFRYAVQHRAYNPPGEIMLRVHCEQEPLGESSITLADTRDSLGMFRTQLDWRISDLELKTICTFVEVAQHSLEAVAEVVPDPQLLAGSRDYLSRCDDSNHHMGGMRMASTPQEGIVDTNLCLYGTRNVYVCSGAVFPTSGYSNPTHTLLALAMRLAEHLS